MMGIIFLFLSLSLLGLVLRIAWQIYQSYQHIDEVTMRNFIYGKLAKGSQRYQRVITHLGQCEDCRSLLDRVQNGKPLEDHLVD